MMTTEQQTPPANSVQPPQPLCVPFSKSLKFTVLLFSAIALFLLWGMIFFATQPILDEDGQPLSSGTKALMLAVFAVVECGILWMCCYLVWRWATQKGAFTLTARGIEHGFVILSLFAFWTAIPIGCIPWEAVAVPKPDDPLEDSISVIPAKLPRSIPAPARWVLRMGGIPYRMGRITPQQLSDYRANAVKDTQN